MNADDRTMLVDTAEKLFAAHCTTQSLTDADPDGFLADLWRQLVEIGLLDMLVPESSGGIDADAVSFAAVLRVAGRSGAPGPIAETMIGRRLVAQTDRQTHAPLVLALDAWVSQGCEISATVRCPPDSSDAALVILPTQDGARISLIPLQRFSKTASRNIAGEALWVLKGDAREVLDVNHQYPASFARETADLLSLARAALIMGALEKIMELSLNYAGERVQFGRPIGKFQAVQQLLASLAGAVAAASAITSAAARAWDAGAGSALIDAARIRLADSIDAATAIAHQVHGAIGITREYSLQYFTRRLWAWRDEAARTCDVRERFAMRFGQCAADELWPQLVGLAAPLPRQ